MLSKTTRTPLYVGTVLLLCAINSTVFAEDITRVSVALNGTQRSTPSYFPSISADARYVVYVSGDTAITADIFVYDRQKAKTMQIGAAGRAVKYPVISGNGRYIAFLSYDTKLLAQAVYVYDSKTHKTERISPSLITGYAPDLSLSADGRYVAYVPKTETEPSDHAEQGYVVVYDRVARKKSRVDVSSKGKLGNGLSFQPSLSADGHYVTFASYASNLVDNDTNKASDIFVHDTKTHQTERVSIASKGAQVNGDSAQPRISANGRWVTFISAGTNLVAGDVNNVQDIFAYNRSTHKTERVSNSPRDLIAINYRLSADGRYIVNAMQSSTGVNLTTINRVFLYDRRANKRFALDLGQPKQGLVEYNFNLSADGRYIVFDSYSPNLVSGDTNKVKDVFVLDRLIYKPD